MARKSKKSRRAVGFAFTSPALLFVICHTNPNFRVYMVTDDTTRRTVREYLSAELHGTRREKLFIIGGLSNLPKMGPKPRDDVHVVVCDDPDLLSELKPYVRVADAYRNREGHWKPPPRNKQLDVDDTIRRIKWSSYERPIHPDKIAEAKASFVIELPSTDKKIDILKTMKTVFDGVVEAYRDHLRADIYNFMAGLTNRRTFSGARRKAFNRLREGVNKDDYKKLFSTFQRWMEAKGEGRLVSAAYQLCSKKGVKPPVAAARMDANLEMLMKLIRFIPPSKKQRFSGWKYRPSKEK